MKASQRKGNSHSGVPHTQSKGALRLLRRKSFHPLLASGGCGTAGLLAGERTADCGRTKLLRKGLKAPI